MFITFEGIDFSGKTTQIDLLYKQLINLGEKVLLLREPGGTDIGEKIRDILLSKENSIHPLTELFLFEASRYELVKKVIKPKLTEGFTIICDRFYDSTTAYQGYGRGLPLSFVEECNKLATESTVPDLTFYIDITIDIVLDRNRHFKLDRLEGEKVEFIERVINGYRSIAKENPQRIVLIDGSQSIEAIHKNIYEIVVKKLMENKCC
ncbi:MAG: dTMP kinase [Candidatus Kapaibacteriales bacterium]